MTGREADQGRDVVMERGRIQGAFAGWAHGLAIKLVVGRLVPGKADLRPHQPPYSSFTAISSLSETQQLLSTEIHKGYLLDELVCLKKINNAMRRVFLRLERLSWVCNPLKRLNVELEVAISHPFNQGHLPAASQASGPRPTGQRRKRNCFCAQPGLRWPRLQQGHLRSPTLQLGVTGNT